MAASVSKTTQGVEKRVCRMRGCRSLCSGRGRSPTRVPVGHSDPYPRHRPPGIGWLHVARHGTRELGEGAAAATADADLEEPTVALARAGPQSGVTLIGLLHTDAAPARLLRAEAGGIRASGTPAAAAGKRVRAFLDTDLVQASLPLRTRAGPFAQQQGCPGLPPTQPEQGTETPDGQAG